MKITVTQVVADGELVFPHLCQHRPDRVAKRMPAHASDSELVESRPDLPLQNSGQIERLPSFAAIS